MIMVKTGHSSGIYTPLQIYASYLILSLNFLLSKALREYKRLILPMRTVSRKSKQLASPCINLIISSFCFFLFTVFLVSSVYAVNGAIFEDDFTGGAKSEWMTIAGSWEFNSTLNAYQTSQDYKNQVKVNITMPDDSYVEYKIIHIEPTMFYFDLLVRATWDGVYNSGYSIAYVHPVYDELFLIRWDGGVRKGYIANKPLSELGLDGITSLEGHILGIRVVGDSIKGYLDGVEILSAVDDTYSSGYAGVIASPKTGLFVFDDYKITDEGSSNPEINLSMIYSKLLEIEDEIISVNETVKDESAQIQTNQEEIYDLLQDLDFGNVRVDISVGSTYHLIGETANIFAKVSEEGQIVDDAFCDVILFHPNQTEIDGFQLNYINNSRGVYSDITVVPDETGVYIIDVDCFRPFDEAYTQYYFAGDGTPAYDLYFTNSTGDTDTYIEVPNVQVGHHHCYPDRFNVGFEDFESGEFPEYRFLHHIENISVWVSKDLAVSKEYIIILKFYKVTDKGELTIGAVVNRTDISGTPSEITFPNIYPSKPFDKHSFLEVEFCVEAIEEENRDVSLHFNNSAYDSGFAIHTTAMNSTLDFRVGGSAGLNVKNYTYFDEKFNGTWLNQQEIYNWLQGFNITLDGKFNNVFTNQQEILNAIINITFNDTAILESISNLNSTVVDKLYLIQDEIDSVNSAIISARADILNQMIVNYNGLVSILSNLPTNILSSFETQTPNWFKCIAQRLTGVYPAGSEC